MIPDMTLERAHKIVTDVIAGRTQFGKWYLADDVGIHNLLDALIVVAHGDNSKEIALREQLTKANRQLAAAKAREVKRDKAQTEEIQEQNEDAR